jgi:hypothetical protein
VKQVINLVSTTICVIINPDTICKSIARCIGGRMVWLELLVTVKMETCHGIMQERGVGMTHLFAVGNNQMSDIYIYIFVKISGISLLKLGSTEAFFLTVKVTP